MMNQSTKIKCVINFNISSHVVVIVCVLFSLLSVSLSSEAPPYLQQHQQHHLLIDEQETMHDYDNKEGSTPSWSVMNFAHHDHDIIRFLAIGDWGGKDTYPYYTEEQWETAAGMAKVAAAATTSTTTTTTSREGLDFIVDNNGEYRPAASFVLSLGDNFYSRGFPEEETSPEAYLRFEETFDNVYDRSMMDLPWFVIGGNHDYCGNITMQMQLSEKCDRWNYPDNNHRIVREFQSEEDDGTSVVVKLEIIMIDTVLLAGTTACPKVNDGVGTIYPSEYFQYIPHEDMDALARADSTLEWIELSLKKSDADYLLVAGHYPIYSACSHGGNEILQGKLDPLLRKYGVTAYLSGHEHCQFHYSYKGMDYILSGVGHDCCYASDKIKSLPKGGKLKYILADSTEYSGSAGVRGGFASFDIGRDRMTFSLHRETGDVLYKSILSPRARRFSRKNEWAAEVGRYRD